MKIGEKLVEDGQTVHHIQTYDPTPVLDQARVLKQVEQKGDWWHVGHIPSWLINEWVKEAGVKWSDTKAVREIVERKLLSGEYNALRPHEGKFK